MLAVIQFSARFSEEKRCLYFESIDAVERSWSDSTSTGLGAQSNWNLNALL
jgi:hypothetical protein